MTDSKIATYYCRGCDQHLPGGNFGSDCLGSLCKTCTVKKREELKK